MKFLLLKIFQWETYAIYIYSCSTQVGGLYGTNENSIRCEKRFEIAFKRCETADIEEFSLGNLCKPYIFL